MLMSVSPVLDHSWNWMCLLGAWAWWVFTSPPLVEALTQFYGKSNVGLQKKLLGANHSHLRGAQNQKAAAVQCNHLLNRSPRRPTHHVHSHWWVCGRRVAACKRQKKMLFMLFFRKCIEYSAHLAQNAWRNTADVSFDIYIVKFTNVQWNTSHHFDFLYLFVSPSLCALVHTYVQTCSLKCKQSFNMSGESDKQLVCVCVCVYHDTSMCHYSD